MGRFRLRLSCRVPFRMKLWCELELGIWFRVMVSVRVRLTVMVLCG